MRYGSVLAVALSVAALRAAPLECAACHPKQAKSLAQTNMAHALERATTSEILRENELLTFTLGPYRYQVIRQKEGSLYSVTDGKNEIRVPILWAFGLGAAGQTWFFENNGRFYESRVSFYREKRGLDLTIGANPGVPPTLEEAAGRRMASREIMECFGCHSVPGKYSAADVLSASFRPGLQCLSCHRDAERHGANPAAARPASLTALSTEDISDLCGSCHRTWAEISSNGPRGIPNVRFQPYRLVNSKCYDATDRRIACVACHDPHGRPTELASRTDATCKSCHGSKTTRVCPKATADCASCHMPKYEIPGSHHRFSDHQIRIARTNDDYPN